MPRSSSLVQCPPLTSVKVAQLFERKAPPQPRRDIPRDQRSFHEERAAPAHRVKQRLLWGPAHQPQNARREILTHRRLGNGGTESALEKCLTRRIEVERHSLTIQKRVNADIWPARRHVGTTAGGHAEAIADRILDPEGDKIQAVQRALLGTDLHLDRAADRKPFLPG